MSLLLPFPSLAGLYRSSPLFSPDASDKKGLVPVYNTTRTYAQIGFANAPFKAFNNDERQRTKQEKCKREGKNESVVIHDRGVRAVFCIGRIRQMRVDIRN